MLTARLMLRIAGEAVEVTAPIPAGEMRLDQTLPLLRQIDDLAIEQAARASEARDKKISCCRGCAACCRAQPVPVTPPEAYALWRLVNALPEPRQSEVRARFAEGARQLHAAGLADAYLDRDRNLSPEQARTIARRYFQLGLVCPFLVEDACGIYAQRPFVCRQYLVTSAVKLCENPFDNPVDVLAVPLAAASSLQRVCREKLGADQFTVPLVLALEYAELHRAELERTFESVGLIERCVEALLE